MGKGFSEKRRREEGGKRFVGRNTNNTKNVPSHGAPLHGAKTPVPDERMLLSLKESLTAATKHSISESVSADNMIIQAIKCIDDLTRIGNILAKRLREWYALYEPEFTHSIEHHEDFVEAVLMKGREPLAGNTSQKKKASGGGGMGASSLSSGDIAAMRELAEGIRTLFVLKERETGYLTGLLKEWCPNTYEVGGIVAAHLLSHAGSLRRLAMLPASTIQLLGAEKALFRHLKTGARSPKHGVLINHPLVACAPKKEKGKVARALADKISLASRVDYFKGEPVGERLKAELEKKFGSG